MTLNTGYRDYLRRQCEEIPEHLRLTYTFISCKRYTLSLDEIAGLEKEIEGLEQEGKADDASWIDLVYQLIDAIGGQRGMSLPEDVENAKAEARQLRNRIEVLPKCWRLVNGK